MTNLILSVATFGAILLIYGAYQNWKREGAGKQMWLMLGAALVIIVNLAIWTIPDKNGRSLVSEIQNKPE
jgi:hypothetical protein